MLGIRNKNMTLPIPHYKIWADRNDRAAIVLCILLGFISAGGIFEIAESTVYKGLHKVTV